MPILTHKFVLKKPSSIIWRRFRQHTWSIIGLVIIAIITVAVILAPLSPYDPKQNSIQEKFQPPTITHPMGTDALGRDVLTRVLFGGRLSIFIGIGATSISALVGISFGVIAGLNGGWIDNFLMRITDVFISFPSVFTFIILSSLLRDLDISFLDGGQPLAVILVIGLFSWMHMARLVRVSCLSLKEKEFIIAAYSLGASNSRIILIHILPNIASIVIVVTTLSIASAILIESGLSFIGFGVHPRTPTWGNMLGDAQNYIISYPWIAIFPSLMIFLTIIAVNIIGDGLRDAIDGKAESFFKHV